MSGKQLWLLVVPCGLVVLALVWLVLSDYGGVETPSPKVQAHTPKSGRKIAANNESRGNPDPSSDADSRSSTFANADSTHSGISPGLQEPVLYLDPMSIPLLKLVFERGAAAANAAQLYIEKIPTARLPIKKEMTHAQVDVIVNAQRQAQQAWRTLKEEFVSMLIREFQRLPEDYSAFNDDVCLVMAEADEVTDETNEAIRLYKHLLSTMAGATKCAHIPSLMRSQRQQANSSEGLSGESALQSGRSVVMSQIDWEEFVKKANTLPVPTSLFAKIGLVRCYSKLGKSNEAIEVAWEMLETGKSYAKGFRLLGNKLEKPPYPTGYGLNPLREAAMFLIDCYRKKGESAKVDEVEKMMEGH